MRSGELNKQKPVGSYELIQGEMIHLGPDTLLVRRNHISEEPRVNGRARSRTQVVSA